MFNKPTSAQLTIIPALYQTEEIPLKDKPVYLHFFIGNSDWYIMEFDAKDIFWGFAILNNDFQMSEFGYFSFNEIASIRVKGIFEVENDTSWQVHQACRIERICEAQGWTLPDHSTGIECPNCKKLIRPGFEDNISCPECKVVILKPNINAVYQGGFHHGIYS